LLLNYNEFKLIIPKNMKLQLVNITYEIEVEPGEKLILPESIRESIGAGNWIITIQSKLDSSPVTRSHDAFLKGYTPEDEGLYDDYTTG
jgi:hypothetical protein